MKLTFLYLLFALLISSCSAIKETSNHKMEAGIYKVHNNKHKMYYAEVAEDTIVLHPVIKTKQGWQANKDSSISIQTKGANTNGAQMKFSSRSFDLDVLTILFKYRPSVSGFHRQLNTNFNAAAYLGHRSDYYFLSYDKNPLNVSTSRISHFAYSLGFFGGLGATSMNPFVTNNQVQSEYDGVVITKGITGLIGVGNLTFGLAIGIDHLVDDNKKVWIYQGKPWFGFTLGLNLN